jgi:hypothetical protein
MKTFGRMMLAAIAAILMQAGTAQADGVGGYLEYSGTAGELEFDIGTLDQDSNRVGFGVTYSTNPQGPELFNYRLDAGYVHTWEKISGETDEWNGFNVNNAFGFRLYQNSSTRVWVGPAIGMGVDVLSGSGPDVASFTVGAGPQLGVNLAASEKMTVALTAGYQYRFRYVWSDNNLFDNRHVSGHGSYWMANVAMMFNTGS